MEYIIKKLTKISETFSVIYNNVDLKYLRNYVQNCCYWRLSSRCTRFIKSKVYFSYKLSKDKSCVYVRHSSNNMFTFTRKIACSKKRMKKLPILLEKCHFCENPVIILKRFIDRSRAALFCTQHWAADINTFSKKLIARRR